MALTRITKGVIKPNENYDTHNIVSTGIVTSVGLDVNGNADISGSLSVGGVLTYEDVTSVDSVGIITAQKDIHVGAGISVVGVVTATSFVGSGAALTGIDATSIKDSGGNVKIQAQASGAIHSGVSTFQDIDVDGHTNLDNVSVAGVTTFSDNDIHFKNNGITSCRFDSNRGAFEFNHSGGLFWYKNGNLSNSSGATIFYSEFANQYKGLVIQAPWQGQNNAKNVTVMGSSNGRFYVQNNLNAQETFSAYFEGGVHLGYYQSGTKLSTTTTGVSLPQDLDVDGHTNLDNVSIAGVTTFASGNVQLASDSQKLQLGSGQDLWMYHTGTSGGGHGLIQNDYGTMYMLSDNFTFRDRSTNHDVFKINENNAVSLYYQNNAKLSTTSTGAQIDTTLRLYGAAGTGGGRLRLAEGAAYSEIRGVRNTDTSSELWFGTEIGDTVDYRAKINTGGHFIPGTDSTYDLGLTGTRWRNVYADTLYGDGSNLTGIAADKIFEGNTEVETVDTGSDGHVKITTEGSERVRIASDGEVFIGANFGTTNRSTLLSISGANQDPTGVWTQVGVYADGGQAVNKGGSIGFGGPDGSTAQQQFSAIKGAKENGTSGNYAGYMAFYTRPAGAVSGERLRIQSGGNVMIGGNYTSTNLGKLCVDGVIGIDDEGSGTSTLNIMTAANTRLKIQATGSISQILTQNNVPFAIKTDAGTGGGTERLRIDTAGQVLPGADDAQNLGSSTKRWANIYAADMHFSNEGKTNDVDGTWGDWTLQEGEDSVYMINNRTGKKYAITMKEVN